ncbi:MAG: glycoside hydrolase family 57 protein, partial [Terriglobia bacterium]
MPPTRIMLLWHMHQPYYKDLAEDRYAMPWVRLHTLKDYYGMVAMLRDFPSVHMTFNLVPSLVSQISDYAEDRAREESYELAFKPAHELTPPEKDALVNYAFQLNHEHLLNRYNRLSELFCKSRGSGREPRAERLHELQEILDLQVLSQLAWFDEIYLASDPEINSLAGRQRNYTEEDKRQLRAKEIELCKVTLEEYRRAEARGQIEISTTPFYHPILPLLCDTNAGAESSPDITLPRLRFQHPEDARCQLREAVLFHESIFGKRPVGLWPSEGSVSEEALRLAAEEGFRWAATDEGVLGRSTHTYFHHNADGTVHDGNRLYHPHRLQIENHSIDLFFRDHQLSDLIGFVYSRMDPISAAHDLVRRIRSAARTTGEEPAVISIILDGENAWEYYPGNGREFLRAFYGLLASEPDLEAATPSEILRVSQPLPLRRLTPGSWINANFNVWIGAEEDNRAWELLAEARNYFAANAAKPGLAAENVELARRELWIAEGSDWCWWYGPEHSTANDEEFDRLYRKHLGNVYRLLGGEAPDELATPIKRCVSIECNVPPSAPVSPAVDGRPTTYFEWLGAGVYTPDYRSASLHESE